MIKGTRRTSVKADFCALALLVAFSTTQSNSCASLRTLTVWQSEEDMLTFVTSPAHLAAMSAVSELSRGTSNTLAWEGSEKDASWERAANYLAAETGGDH